MKYIDAERIKKEIRKLADWYQNILTDDLCDKLIDFVDAAMPFIPPQNSLQEEADLEREITRVSKNEYFDFTDWKSIARHFYEFGLTQKGE